MYVFFSLGLIPKHGITGSYGKCMFKLIRNRHAFPKWLCRFAFSLAIYENSNCSTSSILSIVSLLSCSLSFSGCVMLLLWFLICISHNVELLFMCLFPIHMSSLVKCLDFANFLLCWRFYYKNSLYCMGIFFVNIFFQFISFHFLNSIWGTKICLWLWTFKLCIFDIV